MTESHIIIIRFGRSIRLRLCVQRRFQTLIHTHTHTTHHSINSQRACAHRASFEMCVEHERHEHKSFIVLFCAKRSHVSRHILSHVNDMAHNFHRSRLFGCVGVGCVYELCMCDREREREWAIAVRTSLRWCIIARRRMSFISRHLIFGCVMVL